MQEKKKETSVVLAATVSFHPFDPLIWFSLLYFIVLVRAIRCICSCGLRL